MLSNLPVSISDQELAVAKDSQKQPNQDLHHIDDNETFAPNSRYTYAYPYGLTKELPLHTHTDSFQITGRSSEL